MLGRKILSLRWKGINMSISITAREEKIMKLNRSAPYNIRLIATILMASTSLLACSDAFCAEQKAKAPEKVQEIKKEAGAGGKAIKGKGKKTESKAVEQPEKSEPRAGTSDRANLLSQSSSPRQVVTLESVAKRFNDRSGAKNLKPDSIEGAMISAYDTNPQIKEQRAAVRASDERLVQARAGWRPTVSASGTLGYGKNKKTGNAIDDAANGVTTGAAIKRNTTGSDSATVSLEQNIFNGGATVYATQAAEKTIRAARAGLMATEQDVLLNAVQAYLDLIAQYAQLEVLKSNEEVLKSTLDSTTEKFTVGEETRTSVAQVSGQYAEAIAKRQSAEAQLKANEATYEKVVGRKAGSLVQPTLPKEMPASLPKALEMARLTNPTLLKVQYEEEAARREIEKLNGGLLPKLDLVASSSAQHSRTQPKYVGAPITNNRSTSNDGAIDHSVQLKMSVPLYEAGSVRSQKREATEIAEQRRIAIETQRRTVYEGLTKAWELFEVAKSNLTYYREQVRANEISLDGTQQELLVGSKILLDVLNAQSKLLDAQLLLVQAERVYYLAAYQIIYYIGKLTAKSMALNVNLYNPKDHYKQTRYRF